MLMIVRKLKLLKIWLRGWNKYVFGKVQERISDARTHLVEVQQKLSLRDNFAALLAMETEAKEKLMQAVAIQSSY